MNHSKEPSGTTEHPTEPTPRSSGSARRRRPARKNTRASFGSVRRLPSGRYQARFTDARGYRHTAPDTFATRRDAEDYLASSAPTCSAAPGAPPSWARSRSPTTPPACSRSASTWRPRPASSTRSSSGSGSTPPTSSPPPPAASRAPSTWARWSSARSPSPRSATGTPPPSTPPTSEPRRAPKRPSNGRSQAHHLNAARSWALDRGLRVGTTGRLPAAVVQAWKDAGAVPDTSAAVRPSAAHGSRHGPTRRGERASPRPTGT